MLLLPNNLVKTIFSLTIASVVVVGVLFAIIPAAIAEYDDSPKTYKHHWVISIGEETGTIEITEDSDIATLKEQAISLEEATASYANVVKARLTQAVNDSGIYYLVWKIVTESTGGSDSTYTVNILDAGTGELLASKTKEGGCGYKKSGTTSTGGQV